MKCMHCKKREATVYYSEIINGRGYEINVCEECAKKLNLNVKIPEFSGMGTSWGGLFEQNPFAEMVEMLNRFEQSFFPELSVKEGRKLFEKAEENKEKKAVEPKNQLQILRRELKKAISEERFEDAAVLRDKIKLIEKKTA